MVLRSLIRLVDRVGSYTDPPAARRGIVTDLVEVMGLTGAALWRWADAGLELECASGEDVTRPAPAEYETLPEEGGPTREGEYTWPLRRGSRLLGVLRVAGDVSGDRGLVVGMLARRCGAILHDGVRVAMRQTLLEGLSHELRAPLQSLLGYLDLLRRGTFGPLADAQVEAIDQAARQAERILGVARDVLQVARIDAGKEQVIRGEVDLSELIARELDTVRALPAAAGLDLSSECPADLVVHSDGNKLARILTNLLSNAAKYTDAGSVAVHARPAGSGAVIEVADTGCGIPEDRLPQVFDEYFQVDGTRGGTGLGLAICRRLAKLLEATIEIESIEGRGTTVRVTLP